MNFSSGIISKLQNFESLGKLVAGIIFTFKDDSNDMHDDMCGIDNVR